MLSPASHSRIMNMDRADIEVIFDENGIDYGNSDMTDTLRYILGACVDDGDIVLGEPEWYKPRGKSRLARRANWMPV